MKETALRSSMVWVPMKRSEAARLGLTAEELAPTHKAKDLVLVLDQSLWFEARIDSRWLAAFRLANQRGQPVIAELRAFPDERGTRSPGRWSGEYGGPTTSVPRGGLSASILRNIRTQVFKKDMRKIAARLPEWGEAAQSFFPGLPPASTVQPSVTRGRKGRSDQELARIAAIYERAYLANRPPVPAVAKAHQLSLTQARDAVRRARVRGLLGGGGKQGKAGGLLTDRAKSLLRHKVKKQRGGKRHAKR